MKNMVLNYEYNVYLLLNEIETGFMYMCNFKLICDKSKNKLIVCNSNYITRRIKCCTFKIQII